MSLAGTSSNCENTSTAGRDLPLFRTEVIEAQQQRFYGDVVLIRPLSLTLLTLLTIFLAAILFGFVILGHYTQVAHVFGVLGVSQGSEHREPLAILYVPARAIPFVRLGEELTVRCSSCVEGRGRAIVRTVSAAPLGRAEIYRESGIGPEQALYRVTLSIDQGNRLPPAAKIQAEVPLNRISILKWLFEPPAS